MVCGLGGVFLGLGNSSMDEATLEGWGGETTILAATGRTRLHVLAADQVAVSSAAGRVSHTGPWWAGAGLFKQLVFAGVRPLASAGLCGLMRLLSARAPFASLGSFSQVETQNPRAGRG